VAFQIVKGFKSMLFTSITFIDLLLCLKELKDLGFQFDVLEEGESLFVILLGAHALDNFARKDVETFCEKFVVTLKLKLENYFELSFEDLLPLVR
jgi:hypothetical protein